MTLADLKRVGLTVWRLCYTFFKKGMKKYKFFKIPHIFLMNDDVENRKKDCLAYSPTHGIDLIKAIIDDIFWQECNPVFDFKSINPGLLLPE